MAVKKIQPHKAQALQQLEAFFSSGKDLLFTNYRGLTVQQITELRKQLRPLGADYRVVKNTFARLVMQRMNLPDMTNWLVGPTAVAICRHDSGPVAKALIEFAKEAPALEVKAGLIDGVAYNAKQVEAYSKLPTKTELIAMLMGTMQAPARNLAVALNEVVARLARVLKAVADQKAAS